MRKLLKSVMFVNCSIVSCNNAFENVGVDFAGPLYYMNNSADKESRKCYILLFTCCFSRSIHLKLTTDISS